VEELTEGKEKGELRVNLFGGQERKKVTSLEGSQDSPARPSNASALMMKI
jgi:hypothetical protein